MGVVIVGPWRPRPINERIAHELAILRQLQEQQRAQQGDPLQPTRAQPAK